MKHCLLILFCCSLLCRAFAQFPPQAGMPGSTAISGSSSVFVGWATGCTVKRGYKNIALPDSGYASAGDSSLALGPADVYTVSLGDSGVADLTFAAPIYDAPGPDFAVFENGFTDPINSTLAFLELGFVEVSSDGVNYFRFPATSNTEDTAQIWNGVYMDASLLNNLAGKYIARYGTPFDLSELAGTPGLDIQHITHVRVVDVIGDIGTHACKDTNGRPVNDPYPTMFATGGFDLDAVGAINQVGVSAGVAGLSGDEEVHVFPNPAVNEVHITLPRSMQLQNITLTDVTGKIMILQNGVQHTGKLSLKGFNSGVYYLTLQDVNGRKWVEKIIKLQD